MYSKIFTTSLNGIDASLVEIEVSISNGLPNFNVIGINRHHSRDLKSKLISAIKNSGFTFPSKNIRVYIHSKSSMYKPSYELPIALAVLNAINNSNHNIFAFGSLKLNGEVSLEPGAYHFLEQAVKSDVKKAVIPILPVEYLEAFPYLNIIDGENLKEIYENIQDDTYSPHFTMLDIPFEIANSPHIICTDPRMIRIMQICLGGRHNLLVKGKSGLGKSQYLRSFITVFPSETYDPIIMRNQSAMGNMTTPLRPFIDASKEVKLPDWYTTESHIGILDRSNQGLLQIDDIIEMPQPVQTVLKDYLRKQTPDNFTTVLATSDLCSCGNYSFDSPNCICTPNIIARYEMTIRNSLRDHFDLQIQLGSQPLSFTDMKEDDHAMILKIQNVWHKQYERYKEIPEVEFNGLFQTQQIHMYINLDPHAKDKVKDLPQHRLLNLFRVARTIADLDESTDVKEIHLDEAISYQQGGVIN